MPKRPSIRTAGQVAAVPVRVGASGAVEILLVTSRETRRWIVPKGWPMKGRKNHRAAAIEAREEAGVRGRTLPRPIDTYSYWRRTAKASHLTEVEVYLLLVEREQTRWKEMKQRSRRWFDVASAAETVSEPELADLFRRLDAGEAAANLWAPVSTPEG
ncbi:NUDIX hydrolase [Aureimonas sp. AU4]|jgi:8-oxo-dGTP pyrophosphatase MutT (NUDIX family)|uniref:NUDIX hydrolase n=1 Tax=Aureimonas sp. AU4 TaxID=1638163 RepID=UPI00078671BC|nr:NUDIX hydrolase [Aureimonas sp. AU4]